MKSPGRPDSSAFTNLRTGATSPHDNALLAAILADATNLGLARMAASSQGVTRDQLIWTRDAYIREETYRAALAILIDAHHKLPIAAAWGREPSVRMGSSSGAVSAWRRAARSMPVMALIPASPSIPMSPIGMPRSTSPCFRQRPMKRPMCSTGSCIMAHRFRSTSITRIPAAQPIMSSRFAPYSEVPVLPAPRLPRPPTCAAGRPFDPIRPCNPCSANVSVPISSPRTGTISFVWLPRSARVTPCPP